MDWEAKEAHILYVYQAFKISAGVTDQKEDLSGTAIGEQDVEVLLAECGFHP